MTSKKSPGALAAPRALENDCAIKSAGSHNSHSISELQARRLCRVCALSYEAAITLAPFVFAVVPR